MALGLFIGPCCSNPYWWWMKRQQFNSFKCVHGSKTTCYSQVLGLRRTEERHYWVIKICLEDLESTGTSAQRVGKFFDQPMGNDHLESNSCHWSTMVAFGYKRNPIVLRQWSFRSKERLAESHGFEFASRVTKLAITASRSIVIANRLPPADKKKKASSGD